VGQLATGRQTADEWKPKLICCPSVTPRKGIPDRNRNGSSS